MKRDRSRSGLSEERGTFRWLAMVTVVLGLAANGCVELGFEREREGRLEPYVLAAGLQEGSATLAETLGHLGSPELVLKPAERDVERFYYSYWDRGGFRFQVQIPIPLGDIRTDVDVFVFSFLRERLWLVRLDFDRSGILVSKIRSKIDRNDAGHYYAIDNNVVTTYLEDRRRALTIEDEEEIDDEDVYPVENDAPRERNTPEDESTEKG